MAEETTMTADDMARKARELVRPGRSPSLGKRDFNQGTLYALLAIHEELRAIRLQLSASRSD